MPLALVNARVLLDEGFVENRAVLVENGRIAAVVGGKEARLSGCERHDLGGAMLVPGFVDAQVNGGGGVLFNDAPTVETLRTPCCWTRTTSPSITPSRPSRW
jgi:N-acetylglucosamine-6-phosphate deacetylase